MTTRTTTYLSSKDLNASVRRTRTALDYGVDPVCLVVQYIEEGMPAADAYFAVFGTLSLMTLEGKDVVG